MHEWQPEPGDTGLLEGCVQAPARASRANEQDRGDLVTAREHGQHQAERLGLPVPQGPQEAGSRAKARPRHRPSVLPDRGALLAPRDSQKGPQAGN